MVQSEKPKPQPLSDLRVVAQRYCGFGKNRMDTILVIPAKAGIQSFIKVIDSDFYPPILVADSSE